MIIGLHTCNRMKFTQKTVESLIEYNPDALDYQWVIVDDMSKPDMIDYLEDLSNYLNACLIKFPGPKRAGITVGIKKMVEQALTYNENNMLYLQNDWVTTRKMDLKAIDSFMTKTGVGHIRTVLNKGSAKHQRFASRTNLATGDLIKCTAPFRVGTESFIGGNWHYSDLPGFTNLDVAKNMFNSCDEPLVNKVEGLRVHNVEKCNMQNFLLLNQPFWNLDIRGKYQTPGGRKQ